MPTLDVDVVPLPQLLTSDRVTGRVVVVFDVLRATSTLTTALAAGMTEIRLHPSLDAARHARVTTGSGALLGEHKCLKPDDFDYGNSPGQFDARPPPALGHMATTNGTRAVLQAFLLGVPHAVLVGCLLNRSAVARALCRFDAPHVTLLCAGTEGEVSFEDLLGCGAVLESLDRLGVLGRVNDAGLIAAGTWASATAGLRNAARPLDALPKDLTLAFGARNLYAAGLGPDVVYAARIDTHTAVGIATRDGADVTVRVQA